MRRNAVGLTVALALALLAAPLAAEAQQPAKVPRNGFLVPRSPTDNAHLLEAFRHGLRELGYVEGQTIALETRWAEGRYERLPDLVADLVRLKVDVLVAVATPGTLAARDATKTIPIVMVGVGDPVGGGLVASLARPGGNLTGLSLLSPELAGKRLEVLKQVLPRMSRVAVLKNPGNPVNDVLWRET